MSSKGKQVAGKGSSDGKRKREGGGDDDKTGGRKKCHPSVLRFFEDTADEADDVSDWSDFSDIDNYFMEEDFAPEEKTAGGKGSSSSHIPFIPPKEEEMNEEEFDKMMEERYKNGSGFINFAEDYETKRFIDGDMLEIHAKNSLIWKVKCMVGRERQSAFCLMQKYVDLQPLGTKLQIISVFSVDRIKGFIFIEAEKQQHIYEACNGLCTIYCSRMMPVPHKEVPSLLSTQSKGNAISEGMWVRVKSGKYKGDLAQVVEVNELRKRATVKLIPRIDVQVLAEKYGGGGSAKKNAKSAPRLISSKELDEFRPLIQIKRDRDTNTVYEVIDGHMLKDGYLYKKVSIDSLSCWSVMPSEEELLKFTPAERKESDNFEWLSQIYGEEKKKPVIRPDTGGGKGEGSSMSVTGNTLEMYSLVCFGRKDFGVVTGMEKDDSYKILKEGFEGPVVAAVQQSEIKSGPLDMKFTALDHSAKTIRVNDIVRVMEGPSQGRQGTVKHIYRGVVFLYDENETENGGYFCCKSKICEKVKFSLDTCTEKGGESGFLVTEDFPSSPKSPLSPKKPWQAREGSREFNRGEKDGAFSVGQTLRIRVGPLKGYLCRVLAVRRSDITVKLDSKHKVLSVKSEHLSEVHGRGSASVMSEDPGSSSLKPFDLLGSEGSTRDWISGAGASGVGDRWNTGGSSGESSWPKFPSSSFSAQPDHGSTDPISSETIDAKRDGEDSIWENKVASKRNSSWGAGTSNSDLVSGWEKDGDKSDNLDGQKTSEESWGKKTSIDGNNNIGWGDASSDKSLPDNWGSGKTEVEGKTWDKSSWDKGKSKVSGNSSPWGNDSQSQDKGLCLGDDDPWGKVMGKQRSKDAPSGGELGWKNTSSVVESHTMDLVGSLAGNNADVNQDAGWGKKSTADVNQDAAWGKKSNADVNQDTGWGKKSNVDVNQDAGWGKKSDADVNQDAGWGKKTDADVNQDAGWGKKIDANVNQDAGWGKKSNAGSGGVKKSTLSSFVGDTGNQDTSWAKKDDAVSGGWGKKISNSSCVGDAGNQDTSWTKKDDAGFGGWEKKTSSSSYVGDTGNQDSWGNKSGSSGGNQDSSWEKKTDAGFSVSGRNQDSWGKKSNQNSGSSNTDDEKNLSWEKKNVTGFGGSAEIQDSWGKKGNWSSGSGEDGGNQNTSWGKKTDAGQDSWAKSSNWNSGSGNTSDDQGASWGSKTAAGSGGSSGNNDAWSKNSNWKSGSNDTGNEDSDSRNKSEWSGGYGGRGRSGDRGGYGGRGRDRDRGGFGGRGGDRGRFGGRGGDRGGFGGRGRGRNETGGSWNNGNESGGSWSSRQDDSGGDAGGYGGRGGDRGGFGGRGRGRRDQSGSWNNGNDSGGSWSSRQNDSGGSWSSQQDDSGGDRGGFGGRGGDRGGFRGRGRGRRDQSGSWNNGNDSGGNWSNRQNDSGSSWSSQQNDSGGDRAGFGGRGGDRGGFRGRGRRDQSGNWSNRNDSGGWSSQQSNSGGWSQGNGDDNQGQGWKSVSAETSKTSGGWSSQQTSVGWKGGNDDDNQGQGWKSASVETSEKSGGWSSQKSGCNQADGKSSGGWGKSSGSTNEGSDSLGKNWKAPDVSAGTEWPSNAGKEKSCTNETSVWKEASSSCETADKAQSSGWNQSSGASKTTDGDGEPANSWSKPAASSWEKASDSGKKGGW